MDLSSEVTLATLILVALVALGVYYLLPIGESKQRFRPKRRFKPYKPHGVQDAVAQLPVQASVDQLRDVMTATFERRRVMGFEEYKVFKVVEDEVATRYGHRVFAQTSLGEVLRSSDSRAYSAINSKRVDILVIAPDGYPLIAVEYQGDGHYQSNAAARDAVKKEALRKAGVQYLEISRAHSPDEIRSLVRSALGSPVPFPARPASPPPLPSLPVVEGDRALRA